MLKDIKHIVPGRGGDCVLLVGGEKTALIDAGMAFCGERLVQLTEEMLGDRPLDYVLLTHSHYDHAGGVPALRKRWPKLIVVGSGHARDIFAREGARRTIRGLSEMAGKLYEGDGYQLPEYGEDSMRVDQVAEEGDLIPMGDCSVRVLFTPGHTHCSLSFFMEEDRILFASESIGVYGEGKKMSSPFLTSFQETLASIESCRQCQPLRVLSSHYGEVTEVTPREYLDLAEGAAHGLKNFILERLREGLTPEAILEQCIRQFWMTRGDSRDEQPLRAFTINMNATIRVVQREFGI